MYDDYNKENDKDDVEEVCEQNYKFFTDNFDELLRKYHKKFISIKNCRVIGVYDTFDEAINCTTKTEELGTFLIQECSEPTEDNMSMFHHNNVLFGGEMIYKEIQVLSWKIEKKLYD